MIEECTINNIKDRERYWIKYYNCCVLDNREGGYNLTHGGEEYRSEENPWAKLTVCQIEEIIDKLANSTISIQQLAQDYGVHYNTISNINRCKTWSWLHNYQNNIRQECQGSLHRGKLNPSSKFSEDLILKIINDIKYTNNSLASIARKYSVKDSLVYDINSCKTWTHLHSYKNNIRKEFKEGGDASNEDKSD